MSKRRVVVTGIGVLSPLGLDAETTWQAVLAGKSGVRPLTKFESIDLPVRIAATVQNFNVNQYLTPKEARKIEPFIQYAVAAAQMAVDDSGLELAKEDPYTIGVAVGSGIGGLSTIEKNYRAVLESGPRRISPFFIPSAIINMASGIISMRFKMRGPNISIVSACTTGAHNIGDAARFVKYGDADIMLAGGAEMATTILGIGGFSAARALSTRNDEPEKASRPWDKDRDGFVLGEGAGILVLEEYEHAKKRGAKIYAELVGFGMSADGYHMTLPDPKAEGFVKTIDNSIRDAGINLEDIHYINAHATSTPAGDRLEAIAIKKALGDYARKVAISSTKSMTGHLLGAAGAVEAIFCVLAIRDQVAPPTINLYNPDEDCDLDFILHTARKVPIEYALSNSFGFGGTNASLIFKRIG